MNKDKRIKIAKIVGMTAGFIAVYYFVIIYLPFQASK